MNTNMIETIQQIFTLFPKENLEQVAEILNAVLKTKQERTKEPTNDDLIDTLEVEIMELEEREEEIEEKISSLEAEVRKLQERKDRLYEIETILQK